MFKHTLTALTFLLTLPVQAQTTCGGAESPCAIAGGDYHLRQPADWNGTEPLAVMLFYHGHNGNGRSILGNGGLAVEFGGNGYLLVAPNGARRNGDGPRSYPARASSTGRDDVAFTLQVLDDVASRVPIDRSRIYVSGFSAGGSMAWLMACEAGEHLAGMVSVAGALRRPNPTECTGLRDLPILHIHGFADATVPLEGRGIGDWHQGSLWDSLELARARNGCRSNPDTIDIAQDFRMREWRESCTGAPLRLALHDGGHGLPPGWTAMARAFLEGPR